jgi:hypothetical protein
MCLHLIASDLGAAGCGKTQRALAEFARPLKISGNCLEDLKNVTIAGPNATTHIVFDEFDGSRMEVETVINLLTNDTWETLPARYKWVQLVRRGMTRFKSCLLQGRPSASNTKVLLYQ